MVTPTSSHDDFLTANEILKCILFCFRSCIADYFWIIVHTDHHARKAKASVVVSKRIVTNMSPAVQWNVIYSFSIICESFQDGIFCQKFFDVFDIRRFNDKTLSYDALQVGGETTEKK